MCSSAGQLIRRCSRVPLTLAQVGERHSPVLFVDQNLHSISVLYLPVIILANTVALLVSKQLPAVLVQTGWAWRMDAL